MQEYQLHLGPLLGNYLKSAPIGPKEMRLLLVKSYHKKLTFRDRDRMLISELIETVEERKKREQFVGTLPNDNGDRIKDDEGITSALEASIGVYMGSVLNASNEREYIEASDK